MCDFLNESNLFYFFSTISQTFVALIAVIGVIVVFRMQGLDNKIQRILNIQTTFSHMLKKTFEVEIYEAINRIESCKIFYEPVIDLFQVKPALTNPSRKEFYDNNYSAIMYLSGLIDINFENYRKLCLFSFILIFSSLLGLVLVSTILLNMTIAIIIVIAFLLFCLFVLIIAYRNIQTLFIAEHIERNIIIQEKEKSIKKILDCGSRANS